MEGLNLPATDRGRAPAWRRRIEAVEPATIAWLTLALLLVIAGAFLYYETRGTTFWTDEWDWVLGRRGSSLSTYLDPHNSHFSLVPIAIYKLLFATAGLGDFRPYRVVVILGHLACATLLFVYARRRVGDFLAVLAAALILFLGPAWQNILWPFQIAWLLSIGSGIAALLMLDRRDRLGDIAACALLTLGVASSSVGVAVAVGVAVEVVWERRRRPIDWWIVGVPLGLYALWTVTYQNARFMRHGLVLVLDFGATALASGLSGLLGLSGKATANSPGTLLTWGAPLAIVAAALLVWRLIVLRAITARIAALLAMFGAFWVLVAVGRGSLTHGYDSRYIYISAVLILLVAVELLRAVRVGWTAGVVLTCAAVLVISSNIGAFRYGGRTLLNQATLASADLGALNVARPIVAPDYVAGHFPTWPLVIVRAGQFFAAEREFGSPADSQPQLLGAPESARKVADAELITAHGLTLTPAPGRVATGQPPQVEQVTGGTTTTTGGCVSLTPAFNTLASASAIALTVPATGLRIVTDEAPAIASIRRFADAAQPFGTVPAGSAFTLRISGDASPVPWHLQLTSGGSLTVCDLSGR